MDGIEQKPMDGTSFAYTFDGRRTRPSAHTMQYFEMSGNRAIYKDGWMWSCRVPRIPWKFDPETIARFAPGTWKPEDDPCELYDLGSDYSQSRDVSAQHPDRMRELEALFWSEAEKYQVLPLFGGLENVWNPPPRVPERYTFYSGVENFSQGMIPPILNRSFSITADIEVPESWCLFEVCYGADGVIVANGGFLGGFSLYVVGGKLRYTYSFLGLAIDDLVASEELAPGRVQVGSSTPSRSASRATPVSTSGATTASRSRRARSTTCAGPSPIRLRSRRWSSI